MVSHRSTTCNPCGLQVPHRQEFEHRTERWATAAAPAGPRARTIHDRPGYTSAVPSPRTPAGSAVALVWIAAGIAVALAAGTAALGATPAAAERAVRRATGRAFGEAVRIDAVAPSGAAAEEALRSAFAEIREVERLADPDGAPADGLGALNRAAGGDPVPLDPRLAALLERAASYCTWSQGAHGPLGGRLHALWSRRARPPEPLLAKAAAEAGCDGLRLAGPHAQLAEGRRADLHGFAQGTAVDAAVDALRAAGVEEGYVEIGMTRRGFGPGPGGAGWPVDLPVFPGLDRPLQRVLLRDESLAVASAVHRPLMVGGDRHAPWIDQRTGLPATGVQGVVAVSELAVDARAVAAALFVLGNREGMLRAGVLEPRPSVLWLLGEPPSRPVLTHLAWSKVATER